MAENTGCGCHGSVKLIFACSGAADVGAVADQAARKLTREGKGKMFCLAGIGGRVPGIMKTAATAEKIVAIDGCPLNCAKSTLEYAGLTKFAHVQLADLGLGKGSTPVSNAPVEKVCAECEKALT